METLDNEATPPPVISVTFVAIGFLLHYLQQMLTSLPPYLTSPSAQLTVYTIKLHRPGLARLTTTTATVNVAALSTSVCHPLCEPMTLTLFRSSTLNVCGLSKIQALIFCACQTWSDPVWTQVRK
jgi:hypothetical protein